MKSQNKVNTMVMQTKYIMGHVEVVNIYKVLLLLLFINNKNIINPTIITNFSSIEYKFQLTSLVLSNFVTGRILGQHIAN